MVQILRLVNQLWLRYWTVPRIPEPLAAPWTCSQESGRWPCFCIYPVIFDNPKQIHQSLNRPKAFCSSTCEAFPVLWQSWVWTFRQGGVHFEQPTSHQPPAILSGVHPSSAKLPTAGLLGASGRGRMCFHSTTCSTPFFSCAQEAWTKAGGPCTGFLNFSQFAHFAEASSMLLIGGYFESGYFFFVDFSAIQLSFSNLLYCKALGLTLPVGLELSGAPRPCRWNLQYNPIIQKS